MPFVKASPTFVGSASVCWKRVRSFKTLRVFLHFEGDTVVVPNLQYTHVVDYDTLVTTVVEGPTSFVNTRKKT